jgi:hypothetical protein
VLRDVGFLKLKRWQEEKRFAQWRSNENLELDAARQRAVDHVRSAAGRVPKISKKGITNDDPYA